MADKKKWYVCYKRDLSPEGEPISEWERIGYTRSQSPENAIKNCRYNRGPIDKKRAKREYKAEIVDDIYLVPYEFRVLPWAKKRQEVLDRKECRMAHPQAYGTGNKRRPRCYIDGCAKYGSDECTNDPKTCHMLERMRAKNIIIQQPIGRRTHS